MCIFVDCTIPRVGFGNRNPGYTDLVRGTKTYAVYITFDLPYFGFLIARTLEMMKLKNAMRLGMILVVLYVATVIGMAFTYKEAELLKLVNLLIFGIPTLVTYFVFVISYFNTSRRTFGIIVIVTVLLISYGIYWLSTN